MWPVLFRGNVCIYSEKSSNVTAILGRKCTGRLKVNQNMRSPPLSENSNLEKEWPFLFGFFKNCSVTFNVSSK